MVNGETSYLLLVNSEREIAECRDSLFDVGRSMFDVRVVGFGVQVVSVHP